MQGDQGFLLPGIGIEVPVNVVERDVNQVEQEAQQELVVSKFTSSLGTTSDGSFAVSSASASVFAQSLSPSVANDAVVCSIPSIDMPPPGPQEAEEARASLMPDVGHHHNVPEMAASVFTNNATSASPNAAQLDQDAARQLGTMTSWTKSSLPYAPHAVNQNITGVLSNLIDSRIRAWTLLLLRHSLSTGDRESRNRLLGMLSCSIKLKSTTTSFKTLPLPDSARGQPKEADVILPLLFEAQIQLSIQDKDDVVSLRAPGTVAGTPSSSFECFHAIELLCSHDLGVVCFPGTFANDGTFGLTKIDVRLDTGALLESMVEQARLAVFRAVARATSVKTDSSTATSNATAAAALSGLTFSLNISDEPDSNTRPPSTQLQKARSSALRLNSVLHGKSTEQTSQHDNSGSSPLGQTRKNRSVQWDMPTENPSRDVSNFPLAKRQRIVTSRLRSTKSFGRPHAEHGTGPRNATFGEYGSPHVIWGKDGRLKNHPVPEDRSMTSGMSGLIRNEALGQPQNAMFDVQARPKVSRATLSALVGGDKVKQQPEGGTKMPRTATALENWLVNAAKSGGSASGLI